MPPARWLTGAERQALVHAELDLLRDLHAATDAPAERERIVERMGSLSQALVACSPPPSPLGRTFLTAQGVMRYEGPGRLVPTGEPLASETPEGARALALLRRHAAMGGRRVRRARPARPAVHGRPRGARPRGQRGRRARRAASRGACRAGPDEGPEPPPPGDVAGRHLTGAAP